MLLLMGERNPVPILIPATPAGGAEWPHKNCTIPASGPFSFHLQKEFFTLLVNPAAGIAPGNNCRKSAVDKG